MIKLLNTDCMDMLSGRPDESVDMIFADPPFNIGKNYNSYFDNISDYERWTASWIAECFRVLKPTGTLYLMTMDKHLEWKLPLMAKHGHFINIIKWKNVETGNNGRRFWISTQPIMVYGKTEDYYFNPDAQVRKAGKVWDPRRGDRQTLQMLDYWDDIPFIYAGAATHKEALIKNGTNEKEYPCQSPEMLSGRAILFSTAPGSVVMDPFSGSGTTAISCIKTGRNFIGAEIDSHYYQIAQKRIQKEQNTLFNVDK